MRPPSGALGPRPTRRRSPFPDLSWLGATFPLRADAALQRSMIALSACRESPAARELRAEEAARRLVVRLAALSAGRTPDWHGDASVFDARTMGRLVEYIDQHLKIVPGLGAMGMQVGLSPSHFARKFRHSTGLSLQRVVNRRRIRAALEVLKDQAQALAGVAVHLGFASQSHFTRVFSEFTGVPPAKYRNRFRRIAG